MNRALLALNLGILFFPLIARAGQVDYRWQNVNPQSLIGVVNHSKSIIMKDGSLVSGGWRFSFRFGRSSEGSEPNTTQSLYGGYYPFVRTVGEKQGIQYELLAFGSMIHHNAVDLVRVRFYNLAPNWRKAECRVDVGGGVPVTVQGDALVGGSTVIAMADRPRSGIAKVEVVQNAWGNVSGWNPQQNWATPVTPADPAFRNITVGLAGKPIIYRFKVDPGRRYRVVFGFCEGYWSQPGKRILDVSLDGKSIQTIDPIADAGQNVPMLVTGQVIAPADGWLDAQVRANKNASDQNAILNAIWVFPADAPLDLTALKDGKSNAVPIYRVACGSNEDRRLTTGRIRLSDDLAPGARATFWLRFPQGMASDKISQRDSSGEQGLLRSTRRWWDSFFRRGAQFIVPDRDVRDFYRASLAYTFLLRDRVGRYYVVKPGATIYNAFWYRDGSYITHAQDIAGYSKEAERDLRVFIRSPLPPAVNAMGTAPIQQHSDGAWDAPSTEWDGQGQALWAIVSHYELTGDKAWLKRAYPAIIKGAEWIKNARRSTMQPQDTGTDHYGLLPKGFGEAIASGSIYCYYHDFWGVLGIREAALAAEALHDKRNFDWIQKEAADFQKCVISDVNKAQQVDHHGRLYIPGAPGSPDEPNENGANIWGDIAALYPCQVMSPHDPLIVSTLDRMWDNRLQDEYQYINHPKIWTYITTDWIQALWLQGHCNRALKLFWGYLNHAYTTKGWIEEIYPDTMVGTGDQPHSWAAANFVMLLRNMLVREEGGRLNIMYGIPDNWLDSTRPIAVEKAPTTLGGPISFLAELDRLSDDIKIQLKQVPPLAKTVRIWLHGFQVERVVTADHPPMRIGSDYVDVAPIAGRYEIAGKFTK